MYILEYRKTPLIYDHPCSKDQVHSVNTYICINVGGISYNIVRHSSTYCTHRSTSICTQVHLPLYDIPHGLHHHFIELVHRWVEDNLRCGQQGLHSEQRRATFQHTVHIAQVVHYHLGGQGIHNTYHT